MSRSRSVDIATLGLAALDPDRPKGDQISEQLRDLAERLGPGGTLPSDRQLAEHFGVARMTIRAEINRLVNERLLEVEHGKGTFVAAGPHLSYEWGMSYSLAAEAGAGRPGARVLAQSTTLADLDLARQLGIEARDPVLTIERLRTLDDAPVGIERVSLPLTRFPGLDGLDFNEVSLYRTLGDRWGLKRVAAAGTATAVLPSVAEAGLLEIDPGVPCLAVTLTSRDTSGAVFEAGRSIYRSDRYELAVGYGARFASAESRPTTR